MTREQFKQVLQIFISLWLVAIVMLFLHFFGIFVLGRFRLGLYVVATGIPLFLFYIYGESKKLNRAEPSKKKEEIE